jgi:hypothetical protein
VNWINLTRNRAKWQALVNMVMEIQCSISVGGRGNS